MNTPLLISLGLATLGVAFLNFYLKAQKMFELLPDQKIIQNYVFLPTVRMLV